MLEKGDIEASDCMAKLKRYLNGPELNGMIETLETRIDGYDFEEARQTLAAIGGHFNIHI